MYTLGQPLTYGQVQEALVRYLWSHEDSREKIIRNPREFIEQELGIQIDENVKVEVIDATDTNTIYFVVPRHPDEVCGFALTSEQMDFLAFRFTEYMAQAWEEPYLFANIYKLASNKAELDFGFGIKPFSQVHPFQERSLIPEEPHWDVENK